ncbi:hypothetical protein THERMOT_1333 [Bathymodiolus thermophilus thioautotrophic gill symbiont]|uniref:Uncharacterized protein n=1 Tax=Bathymodiolus thermophilus thioautotrophic gill symbiont TaxID=2360 RepID=A0A1J5TVG1_9GAMM|nr:hypothetical protein [Bathymodiolus thermophilus thioautotrophic gill symbiont]OIR24808.1 hypothetical protein BGC33_14865 [Bathymodiolus thermophilus thioautotrophic gill symbiont]CAB5497369.1 hypothetical protein THERMOS_658 [Bathymodiolus thermophilus thioautotrophic gill symbiont]CAB5500949.1 hypothetical protein THERMOT_1333 [Bathymodiolus thermophilus thioautotrophic gill symbiont]
MTTIKTLLLAFILTISNYSIANIIKDQIAVKFSPTKLSMSERLDLIKESLVVLNFDLPEPLKLDYVNYHNPQYDIIITMNQPLNAQEAAAELTNEPYIDYAKAVGPIMVY